MCSSLRSRSNPPADNSAWSASAAHRSKVACRVLASIGLVLVLAPESVPATTEDPETQARIAFETGRLALEEGSGAIALERFELAVDILGPIPELLYYCAEAAYLAGNTESAQSYADRALEAADSAFRTSPDFQRLILLKARLELQSRQETTTWGGRLKHLEDVTRYCECPNHLKGATEPIDRYYVVRRSNPAQGTVDLWSFMEPYPLNKKCSSMLLERDSFSAAPGTPLTGRLENVVRQTVLESLKKGRRCFVDGAGAAPRSLEVWTRDHRPLDNGSPVSEVTEYALHRIEAAVGNVSDCRCSNAALPSDYPVP